MNVIELLAYSAVSRNDYIIKYKKTVIKQLTTIVPYFAESCLCLSDNRQRAMLKRECLRLSERKQRVYKKGEFL
jgi:hypothetical protein